MKIKFLNVAHAAEILKLRGVIADLFVINYHKTLPFNLQTGIPAAVRAAREIGLYTKAEILLHARLDIEGDSFLSTIHIKGGEIVGVSDCLSRDDYTKGNALRIFNVCKTECGAVVDSDILYGGVQNVFYAGGKILFHNTLDAFDKNYYASYKSHMRLCPGVYIGLFKDCVLYGEEQLKILPADGVLELTENKRKTGGRIFLRISKGE